MIVALLEAFNENAPRNSRNERAMVKDTVWFGLFGFLTSSSTSRLNPRTGPKDTGL